MKTSKIHQLKTYTADQAGYYWQLHRSLLTDWQLYTLRSGRPFHAWVQTPADVSCFHPRTVQLYTMTAMLNLFADRFCTMWPWSVGWRSPSGTSTSPCSRRWPTRVCSRWCWCNVVELHRLRWYDRNNVCQTSKRSCSSSSSSSSNIIIIFNLLVML